MSDIFYKMIQKRLLLKYTLILCVLLLITIQTLGTYFVIQFSALPIFVKKRLEILNLRTSKTYDFTPISIRDQYHINYPRLACGCKLSQTVHSSEKRNQTMNTSTCNMETIYYGTKQRVISYSLFLSSEEDKYYFVEGISMNLEIIKNLYPNWMVYIYTNLPLSNYSCNLICSHDNLLWCNVYNIPSKGDMSFVNGRVWRFFPIGDPNVEIFLSRDLDSLPSEREKVAVEEWIQSKKQFHVIRDSQWHQTEILAGLFGAKTNLLSPEVKTNLLRKFVTGGTKDSSSKSLDQKLLRDIIFQPYKKDILAHDSYFCGEYQESVTLPFSTQRIGENFVGHDHFKELDRLFVGRLQPCPERCRPKHGKNWIYC